MKRFKLIFHITYVIIALAVMYFSIDVLMNTEQYLSRIKLSSYIRFPRYIMIIFLVLSLIMIVEFVVERFNVYKIKEGISDLEDEVITLKAKLYDKSQQEDDQKTPSFMLNEDENPEEDAEEEKDE